MSPYDLQLGVLENRLDLAIGAFSTRVNGLIYQSLHREQHWPYCSDRHPLFSEQRIPAEVITQQRMIGHGYWSQAELARHGFKHSAATVESMEAQLILVLSGAYIGYMPEHYAQLWVDQQRLRALLPATFGYQAPFSMILRRGRSRAPPPDHDPARPAQGAAAIAGHLIAQAFPELAGCLRTSVPRDRSFRYQRDRFPACSSQTFIPDPPWKF